MEGAKAIKGRGRGLTAARTRKGPGRWPWVSPRWFVFAIVTTGMTLGSAPAVACSYNGDSNCRPRTEALDENYVIGYLYIENGVGGISWDQPWGNAIDNAAPDPVDGKYAFVSTPMPKTVFLNVSRLVQLDVFHPGTCSNCGGYKGSVYGAELYVGDRMLTAAVLGYTDKGINMATPPGYWYGANRMTAELDTIAKGSTVTVVGNMGSIGLQGAHASVIRIPVFSAEEVFYRLPHPVGGGLSGASSTGAGETPSFGAATVSLLCFLGLRTRNKARSVATLFAMSVFAGCVGSPASLSPEASLSEGPKTGGSARVHVVDDPNNETGLSDATRGSVYGAVSDPDGLPVPEASVILLKTAQFARTDAQGRFQLVGIPPGEYVLHIDREGFLSYDSEILVKAQAVTKVDVVLDWTDAVKTAKSLRHRHDLWVDKDGRPVDSLVLLDADFDGFQFRIPTGKLILPGTTDVEVNITGASTGEPLVVADPLGDGDTGLVRALAARPAGVAYHLRTTWGMTDPGHSVYSYWGVFQSASFRRCSIGGLTPSMNLQSPFNAACTFSGSGVHHVKVTIHKGVIPLEAAHPNRWGANTTLPIVNDQTQTLGRPDCASFFGPYGSITPVAGVTVGTCPLGAGGSGRITDRPYNTSWAPAAFVPFETRWLNVTLRVSRPLSESTSDAPWSFFYRGAETARFTCAATQAKDPMVRSAPVATKDPAHLTWTWRVPVTEEEADAPYAKATNWCFWVAPSDQQAQLMDDWKNQWKLPDLTLGIVAQREPPPRA